MENFMKLELKIQLVRSGTAFFLVEMAFSSSVS